MYLSSLSTCVCVLHSGMTIRGHKHNCHMVSTDHPHRALACAGFDAKSVEMRFDVLPQLTFGTPAVSSRIFKSWTFCSSESAATSSGVITRPVIPSASGRASTVT